MKEVRSGVSPATGFSAFTRTPKGASSTAIVRVAVFTQPFELLYQFKFGRGETPAVEAMFKITPLRRVFSAGTNAREIR